MVEFFDLVDRQEVLLRIGDDELAVTGIPVAGNGLLKERFIPEEFDELLGHQCPAQGPQPSTAAAA